MTMLLHRSNQVLNKFTKSYVNTFYQRCCKRYKETSGKNTSKYLTIQPTTMEIKKFDAATYSLKGFPPVIGGYNTNGFMILGNKLYGSLATLPQGFYAWSPTTWKDITLESLQLFTVTLPKLEILIIGTGDKIEFISPVIREHFKKQNIGIEVESTRHAISTFNLLLEEKRIVAAALIPPTYIPVK